MNKYKKLYEDIELTCLCTDTYEEAEEYLNPLRELIDHCEVLEKYFADQHNTDEFQHFKLHSDSTLKPLKKDELISYIHMVYNWGVCDENLKNIADNITILDDVFTEACDRIEYENTEGKLVNACECPKVAYNFTPQCCNAGFCNGSNSEGWEEWFFHLAKQKNRN